MIDELFGEDLTFGLDDFGAAGIGEVGAQLLEFVDDGAHQLLIVGEQALEIIGEVPQLFVFGFELFLLETGEATKAHVENRLGLATREMHEAFGSRGGDFSRRTTGALEKSVEASHALVHQADLRFVGIFRRADDVDDAVDVDDGEAQALDDLAASTGFAQIEDRAASDNFATMVDEDLQAAAQRQHHRAAVDDGEHVHAERRLQRGVFVEVREHDLLVGVALEFEHHADAGAVRFVADVGNSLELLVANLIRGGFDPTRLVHHVRKFRHDDGLAILANFFDVGTAAHRDRTAAGLVGRQDAGAAQDDAGGRKVRAGDKFE